MSSEWQKAETGKYVRRLGECDAVVVQNGELWESFVYYQGQLVDRGEWDGRAIALRNASGAMKRAHALRNPLKDAKRREEEDEEEGL